MDKRCKNYIMISSFSAHTSHNLGMSFYNPDFNTNGPDHHRVTNDIPSAGKEFGKMNFFNHDSNHLHLGGSANP